MPVKWKSTKCSGVRYYEHQTRKHGVHPDKYFAIRYQKDGSRKEEGLGWASEGWTEKKAVEKRAELTKAARTGEGPARLKEFREQKKELKEEEERQKHQDSINSLTLSEFFNREYMPYSQNNKKSFKSEQALFNKWILPSIGELPLKKVSMIHLEEIKKRMKDAGKATRSVAYVLAIIRQIFNYAKNTGFYRGENPVSSVKMPKADNKRQRHLTPEEAETLLNNLKLRSPQLHDIALLSLDSGLRAGEVFNLSWNVIDFENRLLHIRDTKNGETRVAYMTERVFLMLSTRKKASKTEYVFTDRSGGKIDSVSRSFTRVLSDIGFNKGVSDNRDKVVFHTLRHTFASWLVQKGVELYTVQKLMGHSKITMTERYSHLTPEHEKRAVSKLNEIHQKHNNNLLFLYNSERGKIAK